jgi:hypothetical protein
LLDERERHRPAEVLEVRVDDGRVERAEVALDDFGKTLARALGLGLPEAADGSAQPVQASTVQACGITITPSCAPRVRPEP